METNTIRIISEFLFIPKSENLEDIDLAIVFGNENIDTMNSVYELHQSNAIKKILITGNSSKGKADKSEAEKFYEKGVELGIPESFFILEKNATNTKENVINSIALIDSAIGFDNINKVLLVCKTFHTRRVLMTANNFFPAHLTYNFLPIVDNRNITSMNWWENDDKRTRVLEELQRISIYTLKGDLALV